MLVRLLLAIGCIAAACPALADQVAWGALRQHGAIALMRHADAPGGFGDPPGFRLEDCATQRNLSAKGRSDAEAVGAALRRERIPIGRLSSSPWCRCLDTARLMNLGGVEIEASFSNIVVLSEQRAALTEGARAVLRGWTGPGVLLVVTHGANIQALTGYSPASGEIVIVRIGEDGAVRQVGRLSVPEG